MSTFANIEDPDEMHLCISSGSILFVKIKKDPHTKEYNFFF